MVSAGKYNDWFFIGVVHFGENYRSFCNYGNHFMVLKSF